MQQVVNLSRLKLINCNALAVELTIKPSEGIHIVITFVIIVVVLLLLLSSLLAFHTVHTIFTPLCLNKDVVTSHD